MAGGGTRTEAGAEADGSEAVRSDASRGVGAVGVVERLKGSSPAEPEGSEGTEDYKGECVADEELRSQYGAEGSSGLLASPRDPRIIKRPPKK